MANYFYKNDIPSTLVFNDSVAIDTETMGLNIFRDRLCLMQLSAGDGNSHIVQFEIGQYYSPNLKKLLSDNSIQKIFHFGRFDIATIKFYLGVDVANIYCTKIASKLVRTYTDSHGLKSICEELLGIEISKKQQSSDWGNSEISDKQIEYASSDVLHLHALRDKLNKMLIRENRMDIFLESIKFLPTRVKLDLAGFASTDIFAH